MLRVGPRRRRDLFTGADPEAMRPTPDYYLTRLFRQLVGGTALPTSSNASLAAYAFCGVEEGVVVLAMSHDEDAAATLDVTIDGAPPSGPRYDYVLSPDPSTMPRGAPETPRNLLASGGMLLNGQKLTFDAAMGGAAGSDPPALAPLTFGFFHWPDLTCATLY